MIAHTNSYGSQDLVRQVLVKNIQTIFFVITNTWARFECVISWISIPEQHAAELVTSESGSGTTCLFMDCCFDT